MSGALLQLGEVAGRRLVEDSADVVIVGSGAAGATAARVLSEAGLEVVVVEEGPSVPQGALRRDTYSCMCGAWRDLGGQLARGRAFIPILQGRLVGGSTAINGAIIHRLPEWVYREWQREGRTGEAVRYGDLERAAATIEAELAVAPTPEGTLGENGRLMRAGLQGVGVPGAVIRRCVEGCRASGRCLQGCPTGRRKSMDVSYIPRAMARGARVYATCEARRVLIERGRATGVRARFRDPETGARGPRAVLHARRAVILAASALQTPLLLRASGVGRRSGLVGRRLAGHPGTAVMALFESPVRMWDGGTQTYECTHLAREGIKLESIALPPELGAVRLPGLGPALLERLAGYDHVAAWAVAAKAEARGTVRRGIDGRASVRYDPSDGDVRLLKRGVRLLCEMAFASGASAVLPGVFGLPEVATGMDGIAGLEALPDDPRLFHIIMTHLFGTAVMGEDPRQSVVRPDGRAHEVDGLYVLDSSCFPTNTGVNPQHSICSYAWVAAERLADRTL